jgi:hypothetical protein
VRRSHRGPTRPRPERANCRAKRGQRLAPASPPSQHDAASSLHQAGFYIPYIRLRWITTRFFSSLSLSRFTVMTCPSDNTQAVDQSNFWSDGSVHWDAHRVGWAIAGGCAVLVRATSLWPRSQWAPFAYEVADCDLLCYYCPPPLPVCRGLASDFL